MITAQYDNYTKNIDFQTGKQDEFPVVDCWVMVGSLGINRKRIKRDGMKEKGKELSIY